MTDKQTIRVLITVPFEAELLAKLQAVSPRLEFTILPGRKAEELPLELLAEVKILYTLDTLPPLEDMPELAWVQLHYAGMDHVIDHEVFRSKVKITNMSGANASQMVEFALMGLLALSRRLPLMMEDKAKKTWDENRFKRFRPVDLRGSTVGIVGYGSIGREVARICHAFGASIVASKRDLRRLEDDGYMPSGMGDAGADLPTRLYPPQALRSMASQCDFLIVTVPLTPQTRGLVDASVFDNMKPTAYLVDISRGGVIDHGALVAALRVGKLAGAALDVYPVEPLPEGSPLWEMPNVIISPHVAGGSPHYMERAAELFAANLKRFLAGERLFNLYRPEQGY